MISNSQRLEKLRTAPEEIQLLYGSIELAREIKNAREKFSIPESMREVFIDVIGDTVLGLYAVSELPKNLTAVVGIETNTAKSITAEIIETLSPVIKDVESTVSVTPKKVLLPEKSLEVNSVGLENTIAKDEVAVNAESVTPPVATDETSVQPNGITEETDTSTSQTVQPLRTMETDMKAVHGYGAYRAENPPSDEAEPIHSSSQSDTLQTAPLVEKPHYKAE